MGDPRAGRKPNSKDHKDSLSGPGDSKPGSSSGRTQKPHLDAQSKGHKVEDRSKKSSDSYSWRLGSYITSKGDPAIAPTQVSKTVRDRKLQGANNSSAVEPMDGSARKTHRKLLEPLQATKKAKHASRKGWL